MKRKNNSIDSTRAGVDNEAKGKSVEEESYERCPYFDNLPTDLTGKILIKLPIKSLLICRCVSKTWKTLISEPDFTKMHFQQSQVSLMIRTRDEGRVSRTLYLLECDSEKLEIGSNTRVKLQPMFKIPLQDAKSFWIRRDEIRNRSKRPVRNVRLLSEKNYENTNRGSESLKICCMPSNDRFKITNSCNGLLCLSDPSSLNPLVICNPVTGEFINLPEFSKTSSRLKTARVNINGGAALGFLPKTDEYKVIKMWGHIRRANHERVYERVILRANTVGTPSWRNVEVDPQISISRLKYVTCLNGVLHWIRYVDWQKSLLCFCLESERFQSFPSPPRVFEIREGINSHRDTNTMGELKGFLYISHLSFDVDVTMWVMKDYGIGESWAKVYNIDITPNALGSHHVALHFGYFWRIKHQFAEGASLLLHPSYDCFMYYELEKRRFKFLHIHGTHYRRFEVISHIPSLISLKDVLKGHNIEVHNIHSRCAKFKLREETNVISLSRYQPSA